MKKILDYSTSKIYYEVAGKGKPVILIHGFGEYGWVWNGIVKALHSEYQLIVPDLPGSGQSDRTDDMSIEAMADVIHEIIDAENIDNCVVIGHSMGGYIALAIAEKYYNQVSAIGLFHSTAFEDSEEKKEARKKSIEFIEQHGAFAFLKTSIPNLFCSYTKETRSALIEEMIEQAHNFSAKSLVCYYEAMMKRPDRTDILKNTNKPVLFMIGKHDNAIATTDMLQQIHLPEKSYIHILQNSGHMGMLEEEELSVNLLGDFLKDVC